MNQVAAAPGYHYLRQKNPMALGSVGDPSEQGFSTIVDLKKTCMTGIRSAGFFSQTQGGSTNAGTDSGTFMHNETRSKDAGKEEFIARGTLQKKRSGRETGTSINVTHRELLQHIAGNSEQPSLYQHR